MAKSKNRNKRPAQGGQPKASGQAQGGTAKNPQASGVPRSPSARAASTQTQSSKAEPVSASRVAERRKAREQERRRQRFLMIGGVVGVIALLAAVAIIINLLPAEAPIPEGAVERYQGIPIATTDQGYARLGSPQARVRVVEYSSFSCPTCLTFHQDGFDTLLERVRAGDITFTYVPMGQLGGVGGVEASRAAQCVNEQGMFWPYHDMLFHWQSLYANQAFSLNRLRTGVENLGLDVDQYNSCMNSERSAAVVDRAMEEGLAVPDFGGTPTFTINGVTFAWPFTDEQLNAAIDTAIVNAGGVPGSNSIITPTEEAEATDEPAATDETAATDEAVVTEEAALTDEPEEEAEETPTATSTEEAEATEEAAATEAS